MAKETEEEIGSPSQSGKSPVGLLADFRLGLGGRVAHPLLDVPMTFLLGVQLRGIRGQPFHGDLGVLGQECLDRAGAVNFNPSQTMISGPAIRRWRCSRCATMSSPWIAWSKRFL
jgi:hypothetical protein